MFVGQEWYTNYLGEVYLKQRFLILGTGQGIAKQKILDKLESNQAGFTFSNHARTMPCATNKETSYHATGAPGHVLVGCGAYARV